MEKFEHIIIIIIKELSDCENYYHDIVKIVIFTIMDAITIVDLLNISIYHAYSN